MRARILLPVVALLISSASVAADVRVREFNVQSLSAVDTDGRGQSGPRIRANHEGHAEPSEDLALYPIGGTFGRDVVVPYYVDLDSSDAKLDWNCSDLTFNGHTGHDPYLRSFAEQRIGVPVFATRDGSVIDVRDNQADENTDNDPAKLANYVVLRHDDDEITQYVHLRKGILVHVGDTVTAGTQIGWVGSSGRSMGPHIHFEARVGDEAYEPMAGPCRAGRSYFPDQPTLYGEPRVFGTTFSNKSFADYPAPPFDDAPHVSTFVMGHRTVYFKVEVANVGASTRYKLLVEPPNTGRKEVAAVGVLQSIDVSLASIWWGLDLDLDVPGTWAMILEINGRQVFSLPFTVVSKLSDVDNRPPNAVTPVFEPLPLRVNQVAVCRATNENLADPDYDVVRYRYEWRVNGNVVRDVTTAAQSDALAHQFMTGGADVSCSVTASDGTLSAQTVTAHSTVSHSPKRRSARN